MQGQPHWPGQAGRTEGPAGWGGFPGGRASFPFHKQPGALRHRRGAQEEGSVGRPGPGPQKVAAPQPRPLLSSAAFQLLPATVHGPTGLLPHLPPPSLSLVLLQGRPCPHQTLFFLETSPEVFPKAESGSYNSCAPLHHRPGPFHMATVHASPREGWDTSARVSACWLPWQT